MPFISVEWRKARAHDWAGTREFYAAGLQVYRSEDAGSGTEEPSDEWTRHGAPAVRPTTG